MLVKLLKLIFDHRIFLAIKFRFFESLVERLSDHSLRHVHLSAAIFQSYDIFENLMNRIIPPENSHIKFFLKPYFVNLISVYAREKKTPLNLHQDIANLLISKDYPSLATKKNLVRLEEQVEILGRKKILFITNMYPSVLHGGGLRIFDIINALSANYDIYLFSTFVPTIDQTSHDFLGPKIKEFYFMDVDDFSSDLFINWMNFLNLPANFFDATHLEYHKSIELLDAAKVYSKKIIFTYMECLSLSYFIKFISFPDLTLIYFADYLNKFIELALVEKYALENCDEAIAVTDFDAEFISKFSSHAPRVINHCVSDYSIWSRLESAKYESIENSVCFVANFQHPPNIDAMLWYLKEVHPLVLNVIPDYKVIIVGSGDTMELKKLSKDNPNIIYTGYVEDIVPFILSSTICISPLISGAGLRGKVNQYAACKKASVNTTISLRGLPFTHMKDTLLADEPQDFANAVIKLLTEKDFRQFIEEKAYQIVKTHFSWDSKIKELESLY